MRNNYPLSINFILSEKKNVDQSSFSQLQQHAIYILYINNIVIEMLPVILRPWCRVANIRKNIIVLETANASWLLRLKYEQHQLLYNLRNKILPSISYIDIKIQPTLAIKKPILKLQTDNLLTNNLKQQTQRSLSLQSAKFIRNVAINSEGRLQKTLERLAMLAINK